MATLASVGLHEVFRRNLAMSRNLRGAWEEGSLRTVAFLVHGQGRPGRILDGESFAPRASRVKRTDCEDGGNGQHGGDCSPQVARWDPATAEKPCRKQDHGKHTHRDMRVHQVPMRV